MTAQNKLQKGFTLIELLVVIGILAVLLSLVLIAINPSRQFQQANNTKRSSDVNAILNAVHQYAVDNSGNLPTGITTSSQQVADTGANICAALVTRYMAALPTDPTATAAGTPVTTCGAAYNTGYTILTSATDNRVTVTAPNTQLGITAISVTR
jgi:type IV pilus assembly protein PilA